MRNKDIAGYISLFAGIYLFFGLGYQTAGLFMQGMALGFFGTSGYEQLKERINKKARINKRKVFKNIVNSPHLTDKEKIEILDLRTLSELRRLKHYHKDDRLS
jgi:hypothetical protein